MIVAVTHNTYIYLHDRRSAVSKTVEFGVYSKLWIYVPKLWLACLNLFLLPRLIITWKNGRGNGIGGRADVALICILRLIYNLCVRVCARACGRECVRVQCTAKKTGTGDGTVPQRFMALKNISGTRIFYN